MHGLIVLRVKVDFHVRDVQSVANFLHGGLVSTVECLLDFILVAAYYVEVGLGWCGDASVTTPEWTHFFAHF